MLFRSGREYPRALESCAHRHHRPGPEPDWRDGSPSRGPAAHQEDQTPGGTGGRQPPSLGALWHPLGHHCLRRAPDPREDQVGKDPPAHRETAAAGTVE